LEVSGIGKRMRIGIEIFRKVKTEHTLVFPQVLNQKAFGKWQINQAFESTEETVDKYHA